MGSSLWNLQKIFPLVLISQKASFSTLPFKGNAESFFLLMRFRSRHLPYGHGIMDNPVIPDWMFVADSYTCERVEADAVLYPTSALTEQNGSISGFRYETVNLKRCSWLNRKHSKKKCLQCQVFLPKCSGLDLNGAVALWEGYLTLYLPTILKLLLTKWEEWSYMLRRRSFRDELSFQERAVPFKLGHTNLTVALKQKQNTSRDLLYQWGVQVNVMDWFLLRCYILCWLEPHIIDFI